MADQDLDLDVKGGSNKTMIVLIALIVLLLIVVGVGAYMFLVAGDKNTADGGKTGEAASADSSAQTAKPALYFAIRPEFTINFAESSKARFLQLSVTVMARDSGAFSAVEKHLPVVRDDIINILADKKFEQLSNSEGKQKLADEILASMQQAIAEEIKQAGIQPPGIEAVYFTSFVMQ